MINYSRITVLQSVFCWVYESMTSCVSYMWSQSPYLSVGLDATVAMHQAVDNMQLCALPLSLSHDLLNDPSVRSIGPGGNSSFFDSHSMRYCCFELIGCALNVHFIILRNNIDVRVFYNDPPRWICLQECWCIYRLSSWNNNYHSICFTIRCIYNGRCVVWKNAQQSCSRWFGFILRVCW